MNRRTLSALLVSGLMVALPLYAQTIPRFAAELAVGGGPRSTRSGEVWYQFNREAYLRAGMTLRLGSPGRFRPVVNADYSFGGVRGDQLSLCGIAPNGSCFQYFPSTEGFAASIGLRLIPVSRVAVRSSIGVARYSENARFFDADVALGLTRRIHLLAHWRRLTWQRAEGGELWFQPLTFGVRAQW